MNRPENVLPIQTGRGAPPPDEIRMVDLLIVMADQRRLFWITSLGLLALVIGAWFLAPKTFRFLTTVEIGATAGTERLATTELAESIKVKIEDAWIPTYQRQAAAEGEYVHMRVRLPAGTGLIMIESRGRAKAGAQHEKAHQAVISRLLDEHGRLEQILRLRLSARLEEEAQKVDQLKDQVELVETRLQRVDEERGLLQQEIGQLRRLLDEAAKQRQRAVSEATDEARAMTLLMIDAQVNENRNRLDDYKIRYYIELPQDRTELEKELDDLRREETLQVAVIKQVEAEIENFRGTSVVASAVQSVRPTGFPGWSPPVVLFAALLLAAVGGSLVVAGARLRQEMRLRRQADATPAPVPSRGA